MDEKRRTFHWWRLYLGAQVQVHVPQRQQDDATFATLASTSGKPSGCATSILLHDDEFSSQTCAEA